jgi:hypothetical protein
VLSWLPTERDPALHVHNLSFIEYLLQIAWAARQWGGDDVLEEVRKRLMKWSIAVSLHQWDALENGIYALAAIAVAQGKGEMLLRGTGATVAEIMKSTGWKEHSCRAFLTGVRKTKKLIKEQRPDGKTAYRIEVVPAGVTAE